MNEEKKFFYANSLEIGATAFDINFKFLRSGTVSATIAQLVQAGGAAKQTQAQIVDEFVIGMSPQHAKIMLSSLVQIVKLYETQYGPLPDLEKLSAPITVPNVLPIKK
jgi:hypothetical protein